MRLYLILSIFLCTTAVQSAQMAIVKKVKAVIYADRFMKAPIGTVSKDKKLKVSESSKFKGYVFAVVISGRIAYIKSEDITILSESGGINNEELIGYDSFDNDLYFMLTSYKSNYTLNRYSASDEETTGQTFSGFDVKWQRRYSRSTLFRFGFEYLSFSNNGEKLVIPSFSGELIYELINLKEWRLRTAIGFSASPQVPYEVSPYFNLDGLSYAFLWNLEGIYFFKQRWFYTGMLGLRSMKLFDFALPAGIENFSPTLNGVDFKIGIGWSF